MSGQTHYYTLRAEFPSLNVYFKLLTTQFRVHFQNNLYKLYHYIIPM